MKRLLLIGTIAVLLFAQGARRDAAKLFEQRKYGQAADLLEQHLRKSPGDLSSLMLLGLCRQQLEQYAKAEESFLQALKLAPGDAKALYSLARVRFLQGRFEEALSSAGLSLQSGESPARVHYLRGRIEEERGRFAPALDEYRRALEADRLMVEALLGEASVLYKLGRYPEAKASAQEALRLDAANAEAQHLLGRIGRASPSRSAAGVEPVHFVRQDVIPFRLEHFPTGEKSLVSTMAGGLAVFDYDNDGRNDLFFANGAEIPSLRKTGPRFWNRLYRNLGNWRFADVTESQGLQGEGFSMGAAAADFDNDGRVDLFVPGAGRNLLYRNTGSGYVEISREAGIRNEPWSVGAAWVDYDRDGLPDLFVVNYLDWKPSAETYCGDRLKDVRVYCHPREFRGLPNRLYRNLGNGKFQDVSERTGIASHIGKGMSAAVIDADLDGWPDIYVTNDTEPNFLFLNKAGDRFEEAGVRFGVALNDEGKAISSMGVDARDYNNDGLPDLIVTALTGENFPLFQNTGNKNFTDATFPSRLGISAARRSGWGVSLADLNNDGWKDLFTANSHVTDNIEKIRSERYLEPNTVFLNRAGVFAAAQEIGVPAAHRGLAIADLDNDGRLDAVVTVLGEKPEIWRNETAGGNWLRLRLEGRSLGARVRIGPQWQERTSSSGYASSNLDAVHFGLGAQTEASEVEIVWPSKTRQLLRNVKAGQTLLVREPARP